MRQAIKEGRDPVAERKRPATPTFEQAARGALECRGAGWRGARSRQDWWASIENHCSQLLPRPVDTITGSDVLRTLAPLWGPSPVLARALRQRIRLAFKWAMAYGHIEVNPAGEGIDAAIPAAPRR